MDRIFRDAAYVQFSVALNGNLAVWYSSGHFILLQRLILLWESEEKRLRSHCLL